MDLGLRPLDLEHREIFELMRSLADYVEAGDATGAHRRARDYQDLICAHFAEEERLMREHGYPDQRQHTRTHGQTRRMVAEIVQGTGHSRSLASVGLMLDDLAQDYFRQLLQEDGKMVEWLRTYSPDRE